jgi:carbamoyltransferase
VREDTADWFALDTDSPYMLIVADVREDKRRAMTADVQALLGVDKVNVAHKFRPSPVWTIPRAFRPCTQTIRYFTGC